MPKAPTNPVPVPEHVFKKRMALVASHGGLLTQGRHALDGRLSRALASRPSACKILMF